MRRASELVHAKDMVALVAPEFFPACFPGHYHEIALCLALGAPAIDRLFGHAITSKTLHK
jgi:hypothetical protein